MGFDEMMCKSMRKWINFLKRKGMRLVKGKYQVYHFHSGFFYTPSGKLWYWMSGDDRWSKTILIRTAEHERDYHGGSNRYPKSESDFDMIVSD